MRKFIGQYWPYVPPLLWLAGFWFISDPPKPILNWLVQIDLKALEFIFPKFDVPLLVVFWIGFGCSLLLGWGITKLFGLYAPRFYFGTPDVRDYDVRPPSISAFGEQGPRRLVERWRVASVPLFNNPYLKTSNGTARNATANAVFIDVDTKAIVLGSQFARWAENIQPGHPDSPSNISGLKFRNISPNDAPNLINLVMKIYEEKECYALTFESWPGMGARQKQLVIDKAEILLVVTIKSDNIKNFTAKFILKNGGANSSPILTKTTWHGKKLATLKEIVKLVRQIMPRT